jgi:hypothetical protein
MRLIVTHEQVYKQSKNTNAPDLQPPAMLANTQGQIYTTCMIYKLKLALD